MHESTIQIIQVINNINLKKQTNKQTSKQIYKFLNLSASTKHANQCKKLTKKISKTMNVLKSLITYTVVHKEREMDYISKNYP